MNLSITGRTQRLTTQFRSKYITFSEGQREISRLKNNPKGLRTEEKMEEKVEERNGDIECKKEAEIEIQRNLV